MRGFVARGLAAHIPLHDGQPRSLERNNAHLTNPLARNTHSTPGTQVPHPQLLEPRLLLTKTDLLLTKPDRRWDVATTDESDLELLVLRFAGVS